MYGLAFVAKACATNSCNYPTTEVKPARNGGWQTRGK